MTVNIVGVFFLLFAAGVVAFVLLWKYAVVRKVFVVFVGLGIFGFVALLFLRQVGKSDVKPRRTLRVAYEEETSADKPEIVTAPDDLASWHRDDDVLGFSAAVETPDWVDSAAGSQHKDEMVGDTDFAYWKPGDSGELVGYSGPAATEPLAILEAKRRAREKLAALALLQLKKNRSEVDVLRIQPLADRLASGGRYFDVKQSFVERGKLSDGRANLYRAAVLVAADETRVTTLARELSRELKRGWLEEQERNRRIVWAVVAVIVVTFVVFLIYSLMNAGTKGHFAWPLRIASVGVFLAVCFAFYYLRMRMGLR